MSDITNFVQTELYPSLFERVDRAFPEMGFQRYRGGWISPFKLNGERSHDGRRNKSVITPRLPQRVLEQGGDSIDLISLYMERNNLSKPIDAIKALCSICGLTLPPMGDAESYRLWQEKQERLERAASQMEAALYTDEGAATLNYLKEVRGYSDEFIKGGGFGFVTPSLVRELKEIFKDGSTFPNGVGSSHTLAIPFRTGGAIKGFIFRSINPDQTKQRYLYLFLTKGASQKFYLFGLTGLRLTGNGERDRDIIVVEGQIDALRASFAGLPNVVAGGGGEVSREALQEAKRRGVKRVILLLDADEAGRNYTEKAIATIQAEGLTPLVATLPSTDGEKVDVDSYLRDHTPEDLKEIVDNYLPASRWLFYRFGEQEKYKEGLASQKLIDDYKRETIALCNSPITTPTDRDIILREFSESTGITKEALQEEADLLKLAQDADRQKRETIELASEALKLANNGSVDEALSLLQGKVTELSQISREAEYLQDLALPTLDEISRRRRERPKGIATGYSFKGKRHEFPLILPSGGLTLICGQTSHGKSRMLENLALQIAQNGDEGAVFYFSFEEDCVAVEIQLLNIFANIEITRFENNLQTLNEYYTDGSSKYFRQDKLPLFKQKEAEFDRLLTEGKLRILAKYNDGKTLAEAIRTYTRNIKVKAVFVDYIQLMSYKGSKTFGRKDELREVCEILKDVAKETGLPLILAAQLNRQAASPVDMSCQNLADAADIEHSANIVMLLWNSKVKPKEGSYYTDKGQEKLSPEARGLEERGFTAGQGGKLYAILDKNRGGERYIDAILDFDQNTGYITPNYSEPQPLQGNIFSDGQGESYSPF